MTMKFWSSWLQLPSSEIIGVCQNTQTPQLLHLVLHWELSWPRLKWNASIYHLTTTLGSVGNFLQPTSKLSALFLMGRVTTVLTFRQMKIAASSWLVAVRSVCPSHWGAGTGKGLHKPWLTRKANLTNSEAGRQKKKKLWPIRQEMKQIGAVI